MIASKLFKKRTWRELEFRPVELTVVLKLRLGLRPCYSPVRCRFSWNNWQRPIYIYNKSAYFEAEMIYGSKSFRFRYKPTIFATLLHILWATVFCRNENLILFTILKNVLFSTRKYWWNYSNYQCSGCNTHLTRFGIDVLEKSSPTSLILRSKMFICRSFRSFIFISHQMFSLELISALFDDHRHLLI